MSERRIVVVTAGVGVPSSSRLLADSLSDAAAAELRGRSEEVEVTTVELRDHGHALVDALVEREPGQELQRVLDAAAAADALIVVSPTMSAGVNGLLKMFFDVLPPGSLDGKPVILGATGGSGRHALMLDYAMRPLFSYLRAEAVGTGVFAGPEDFTGQAHEALQARVGRAARELADAVTGWPSSVQAGDRVGQLLSR